MTNDFPFIKIKKSRSICIIIIMHQKTKRLAAVLLLTDTWDKVSKN